MIKYPLRSHCVEAIYTSHVRAIFAGNPNIEALPNLPDDEELFHSLKDPVPYSDEERKLPNYERHAAVQSLAQVFVPIGQNGTIARQVYNAIREGYVNRNPMSGYMKNVMIQLQDCVKNRDYEFRSMDGTNANDCGFCVIGDSGLGKTTAYRRALNLFPRMIVHTEYQGKPFHHLQIVWMKLECTHDVSVKGLCSQFFMQFDELTGDNTYQKFASGGRATVDQMIPQMAILARRHSLGLLVIDEIQNISHAKSGGEERMMNFIVQLVNTIGLPVLLVGTHEAMDVLSRNLKAARRSTGQQGMTRLHPLKPDSTDWDRFSKGIWKYQWTTTKSPLTVELKTALHQFSFGNLDAAVKLYMETQRRAIMRECFGKDGTITVDLLKEAYQSEAFRSVLDCLEAEQQWEKENLAKKQSTADIKRTPTIGNERTPAVRELKQKKRNRPAKSGVKALEEQGLLVSPDDDF